MFKKKGVLNMRWKDFGDGMIIGCVVGIEYVLHVRSIFL